MNKEIDALVRLRQEEVDIQLIFCKHIIDSQMTKGRIGEEYVIKYSALSEVQKWKLARALDKAYKYNIDAWNDEIQYAIDVMETKYYNEQD